jgi:hypothetical protein
MTISNELLPEYPEVTKKEILVRHVVDKDWVKNSVVTKKAFEPVMRYTTVDIKEVLGLSVTRKLTLEDQRLKELGQDIVALRREKNPERTSFQLMGMATFEASVPLDNGLMIVPDNEAVNHANLINWPSPILKETSNSIKSENQLKVNEIKDKLASSCEYLAYD